MRQALLLADRAADDGEVPVGSIIVRDGAVIGQGWNRPISCCDPTAHAEVNALRDAAARTHNYRLVDAILYVTLEPCLMCAGAMVHARIGRLVYGAPDPKRGAVNSTQHAFESQGLNHRIEVSGAVLQDECAARLRNFFQQKRS